MLRHYMIVALMLLYGAVPAAQAEMITLWCSGNFYADNTSGQQRSGAVSTTVVFDEENHYFMIKDSTNLEVGASTPYRKLEFSGSNIFWQTEVNRIIGNGTFFGSINRTTGEMTTNFGGSMNNRPELVTIKGSLICEKQVGRRF